MILLLSVELVRICLTTMMQENILRSVPCQNFRVQSLQLTSNATRIKSLELSLTFDYIWNMNVATCQFLVKNVKTT